MIFQWLETFLPRIGIPVPQVATSFTETMLRKKTDLDRAAVRQEQSRPALEKIKEILDREQPRLRANQRHHLQPRRDMSQTRHQPR